MTARFALVLAVLIAAPMARAAEVTEVADAADTDFAGKEDPFDLEIEIGWHHVFSQGKITRENRQVRDIDLPESPENPVTIVDVTELRHVGTRDDLLLTARAGLYHDLELHFTLPIVLMYEQVWRHAQLPGLPANSTLHNFEGVCNESTMRVDPSDPSCQSSLIPGFQSGLESYRGGGVGDGSVGFAWGIVSNDRDPYTSTWVIGADYIFPSGGKWDPTDVSADSGSPRPIGLKTNFFHFYTALSKRIGFIDPFVKFYYTLPVARDDAYHNCEDPSRLADHDPDTDEFENTCTVGNEWRSQGNNSGGFAPPHVGGVHFGVELLPYVDPSRYLRVAFELSFGAAYVSEGRAFNELSDVLQKALYNEEFVRIHGTGGLRVQASRFAKFHILGSLAHDTEHMLTAETIGKDLDGTNLVELPGDNVGDDQVNPEINPNYDFRYDQPGRRFRISETTHFTLWVMGEVNF